MIRFSSRLCGSALVAFLLVLGSSAANADDWKERVIYQIVTDRFVDGDAANDDPPQSKGLFDPFKKNWQAYWGGDLKGIESKIGYLRALGVGAVWISPAQDCVNRSVSNKEVVAPYHGYWPRDFKRIDEHFGDTANSWAPFDHLAASLHREGIKLIVDFVPNHSNPIDSGEHGLLLDNGEPFATPKTHPEYFHLTKPVVDWNNPDQLQHWMVFDLADLNQDNPTVSKYLLDSARLLQQHGADGFRIDSMKHVNWNWLPQLAATVRKKPGTFIFGEWFQGATTDPTFHDSVQVANKIHMSELDYPLAMAIRRAFGSEDASFAVVRETLDVEDAAYENPGELVTFLDNHDIPRFLNIQTDRSRLHQALVFLLMCRGVPCVYYGTEQYLFDATEGGKDPYDRPMMVSFDESTPAFQLVKWGAALRREHPAVASGSMQFQLADKEACCFCRNKGSDILVVAFNKGSVERQLVLNLQGANAGGYTNVVPGQQSIELVVDSNGHARSTLPPSSCAVWCLSAIKSDR